MKLALVLCLLPLAAFAKNPHWHLLGAFGAIDAWKVYHPKKEVIVAVLDSGIDLIHEDLKHVLWVNKAEKTGKVGIDDDQNGFVDDIYGTNTFGNSADVRDDNGHGTQVSGLIAGKHGVAPSHVKLMTVKIVGAGGVFHLESAVRGIHYAVKNGASIINASWNLPSDLPELREAIRYAENYGVLFINSAGNDGVDLESESVYPSLYNFSNMVTVANLKQDFFLDYTSNFHPEAVHLAAPGTNIFTTTTNNTYREVSGTSFSAPLVAGAAAMYLAQFPERGMTEAKAALLNSARPLFQLRKKVSSGVLHMTNVLSDVSSSKDPENPLTWENLDRNVESLHPYPRNSELEWIIGHPDASTMVIYFDKFQMSFGDRLEIWSIEGKLLQTFEGRYGSGFESRRLPGQVKLRFISDDDQFQAWGFRIGRIALQK